MIFTSDFKKGIYLELDGVPYQIVEFQHVKPGKGNAFVRTRLKNLVTNNVLDRTFKSGESFQEPELERRMMQYLYKDQSGFHFLDLESYEQVSIDQETVAEKAFFLVENLQIDAYIYKGKAISMDLPNFVNLQVEYTEPGMKGDTVSGGGKPAKMMTGLTITVPFHIKQGDVLKIDTRTNQYVEKVK